jgi:hypothetical protein
LESLLSQYEKTEDEIKVPTLESISSEYPEIRSGEDFDIQYFLAVIHVDLGIYYLYAGKIQAAHSHFINLSYNFIKNNPHLSMTEAKFVGYKSLLGISSGFTADTKSEEEINDSPLLKIPELLKSGSLNGILNIKIAKNVEEEPLELSAAPKCTG